MIKVIFTIFVILFLAITSVGNHRDQVKLQKKALVEAYPAQAEKYLENKYGEKFDIDPDYDSRPSGPIPGDTDLPYIYKVQEKDGDQYMFQVYVYPKSDKDKNIKEIADNYYWKTIEKETKEYLENQMSTLLPEEHKIVFITGPDETFGDVELSVPMETYLSTIEYQIRMRIYIIAPPDDGMTEELFTKEKAYLILRDFYLKNDSKIRIIFTYCRANSNEDFQRINVNQLERSVYIDDQEYDSIWSSVNWTEKFEIQIR